MPLLAGIGPKDRLGERQAEKLWHSRDSSSKLGLTMRSALVLLCSTSIALSLSACKSADRQAEGSAPAGNEAPAPAATSPLAANATPIKPLEQRKFGKPVTEKATTTLTALVSEPGKFAEQTVRTEGIVSAVCKSMGCWMEIADESGQAHIKMAGHSFFVPREASGHRAVIEGKVLAGEGPDTCAQKDNCREQAQKETGRVAKVEIEATGVEFID
jgi:hypothetical protein